jgi:alpha-ketoglutarate-dependent taurine dioxygenase
MSTLTLQRLSETVGAEVVGLDPDRLVEDPSLASSLIEALEQNGVLIFRGLDLQPEAQVAFCQKLGEIDYDTGGHHPVAGIFPVTLDKAKNAHADFLKGTFDWHIDGCTPLHDECPQMATILSAKAVAESGGETEFASTYAAYDALSEEEKERFATLRVVHSLEASQRSRNPDPPEQLKQMWNARRAEHPLVWTHRDGRKSLVLGASADYVVGMDEDEGRALLKELLDRSTATDRVYRHSWSVGDTVIWDNRGVLHRASPYPSDSPREMLRTTVLGDEPIQ